MDMQKILNQRHNYMPALIKHGFGDGELKSSYSLFYNPSSGVLNSEWRSLKDGVGFSTQAAKKLAEVLISAADEKNKINLTVHENGHALLKSALRIVAKQNKSLENFTVYYANPTHNLQIVDKLREKTGMALAPKAPLINILSVSQYIMSGNILSDSVITGRADPNNRGVAIYNAIQTGVTLGGLSVISGEAFGITAALVSAAPFLLGQGRELNQKVIDSSGKSVQEGLRYYREKGKKYIWDPIHKMMVWE